MSLSTSDDAEEALIARAVLLATGRFGPLLVQRTGFLPSRFRRFEIGVRIEQPTGQFFLADHPQVDPKFIFTSPRRDIEYRTFCCCRNGEIVAIEHEGILALSGRADGNMTGMSNVGFHLRILDEAMAQRCLNGLLDRLRSPSARVQMELSDFLCAKVAEDTPVGSQLGAGLAALMADGLRQLVARFGDAAFSHAVIHYPAVEGLGGYPMLSDNLRVPDTRIWAAGDVNGRFRGLVAALVSGYFSGLQIAREMRSVE
ncbi:hypothetical protein [Bradyrhizobium sp. USDA 4461]